MTRTYETIYDTDNAFDWERITSTFIDGILTIEDKFLDSGFRETTFYRDGYVSSILTYDSADDVYNWTRKSTAFDADGAITAQFVYYDDGRSVQENITDGIITSKIIKFPDTGADNALAQLSTIYGDDEVVRVFGRYTNGTTYQDEFTDGVRDTRYWSDRTTDGSDGAKPWTSITIKYDITTNDMTDRTTYFDNGVKRTETFEDGIRINRVDEDRDDVKNWDLLDITYDDQGRVAERTTTYDDGDLKVEQFENGLRTVTTRVDDPNNTGVGDRPWDTITEVFDQNGVISQKQVTYDNGSTNLVIYEDGQVQFALREDLRDGTDGAYNWDTIFTTYDAAGNMSGRQTVYDNADELIFLYEQNERQTRLDIDGDDSASWLLRVTDYAVDENTVSTYDTINDVPAEYLEYFGVVAGL